MKKQFLLVGLLSLSSITFGQNFSSGTVFSAIPPSALGAQEIFRFQPGALTQLQSAADFTFGPTDRWMTHGQVNAGSQSFYGSRYQYDNSAFVTGYTSANPNNPRIQWIGSSATSMGNMEFRRGIGFTGPGSNLLVASMTPFGSSYFGDIDNLGNPFGNSTSSPRVGIISDNQLTFQIQNFSTGTSGSRTGGLIEVDHNTNFGNGLAVACGGGVNSIGIDAKAFGTNRSIGVRGRVGGGSAFEAGIFGDAPVTPTAWAGFFDGNVFSTGAYLPSDAKLKDNVTNETNLLERLSMLRPVTYTYKDVEGINLESGDQHGFISQEMAEVFPELTKDITKPVFDEDGKIVSELSFKSINYVGLISVLTGAVQELNTELEAVRDELDEYKANDNVRSKLMQDNPFSSAYSMEQNTPNPFEDRSVISYKLAPGVNQASITVFNLNGGFVKDYQVEGNAGEITILASDIGRGMFIYSLTQNGQEMISKRMIVK